MKNNTNKASKKGLYIVAVSAIVIVLVIVLNLIVGSLPTGSLELDITGKELYRVSSVTKEFLASLNDEIEIVVVAEESAVDERVMKAINGYASESPKVTVKTVDPVTNPSALKTYGIESSAVVVVDKTNGKQDFIAIEGFDSDAAMLKYDANSYYYYGQLNAIALDVDGQLTGTINTLAGDSAGRAYIMTNHGEAELSATITDRIAKLNISTATLNLLMSGAIPDDCELLVCNNPSSDMTAEELQMIEGYLASGGKMILTINDATFRYFGQLMSDYGLQVQNGLVADTSRFYQTYARYYGYYCFAPVLKASSNITSGLKNDAIAVYALGMAEATPVRSTIEVETFMSTSVEAVIVDEDNSTSEPQEFILGAVASEPFDADGDGNADYSSRLTVISAANLIDEGITSSIASISNVDIYINAFAANFSSVSMISVPAKSLAMTYNNMEGVAYLGIAFIAVIPIAFLVCGFVCWSGRRKK